LGAAPLGHHGAKHIGHELGRDVAWQLKQARTQRNRIGLSHQRPLPFRARPLVPFPLEHGGSINPWAQDLGVVREFAHT
jgi:hypothetical protein